MNLQMDISLNCEKCGEKIYDKVSVQDPDFSAERSKDSQTDSWQEVYCEKCGQCHEIQVTNTFSGASASCNYGTIKIDNGFPYYPEDPEDYSENFIDWYIESNPITAFKNHLINVKKIMEIDIPGEAKFSLLVMLHGHIVSAVEGYLAATFIHNVTRYQSLTRKLVETNPTFAKQTFSMKEIFEKHSSLESTVASYLKDLIFHELKVIKPMFRTVLGHDFGEIGWLFKAVSLRHDCVHRAGYDKENKRIDLSEENILILLENVELLADRLELTIANIEKDQLIDF